MLAAPACSAAPECENAVRSRVPSPDRAHDAVIFTRACGATTAESVQISVLATRGEPTGKGNLLIADGVPPAALSVRWLGPDVLAVTVPASARTFHTADVANGVRVVYR